MTVSARAARGSITIGLAELHGLIDAAIEARTDALTARVLAKIAAMLSAPAKPAHYSSRSRGERPRGYTVRRWQKVIQRIPGASKRGRFWVVSTDDFEAWDRAGSDGPPGARPATVRAWSPDEALASVGLRVAGGRR